MGEISDSIIDGECCALCGQFFVEVHGYPCACSECWEPDCGYQQAEFGTI